jgi:hypothetical protein
MEMQMTDSMSQHCPNCEAQAAEIERLRKENDIRQGRIERLEKLHRDIISYQAGKAEQ